MRYLLDKISMIILNILIVGIFLFAIHIFVKSGLGRMAFVGMNVLIATGLAIIAGILFYVAYGEAIANKFTISLLWNKSCYKKLNKSISIANGYIKSGKFDEAIIYLNEIIQDSPTNFSANYLLFQLYLEKLKNYDMVYQIASKFFKKSQGQYTHDRITFLVRYSQFLMQCNLLKENINLLQNELKNKNYRNFEREAIKNRLK